MQHLPPILNSEEINSGRYFTLTTIAYVYEAHLHMFMKLYMPGMFIVKEIEKVMTHLSFLLLKMLLGARISSRMIIL